MIHISDCKIKDIETQYLQIQYNEKDNYFYLDNYFPKYKKKEDAFSKLIILYKKGDKFAIKYFENIIVNIIFNYFWFCDLIVPIPPSSSMFDVYSNKIICLSLNSLNIIQYKQDILKRSMSSAPSHITNKRDIAHILDSVKITNDDYIKDKKIILFDDIITTGNTSSIIKNMLISRGACSVIRLFLGRTINL
ncbi:MAG: hypothetical protein ACYCSW_06440 [bacterium]